MKRFKHSLSHYALHTLDMGQLIPVGNFEVLPGDSIRMSTSALLRVSPLLTPVMHPVQVRIHHWFVPYRLLWDQWEDFITGGPDGTGSEDPLPKISVAANGGSGSLLDYMGVPGTNDILVSAFPIQAYNTIWNEFYRDQDLQPEVSVNNAVPLNCAWEKDQFTAARPWTQKGPDVTLPLGTTAPVVPDGTGSPSFSFSGVGGVSAGNLRSALTSAAVTTSVVPTGAGPTQGLFWQDPELRADLSSALAVDVNQVRLAFALQRYQEARAQYGSRYTEYLRYLGVRSSDARLQRPEYLGGGRSTISFSEVLRTGDDPAAPDPEAPIGEMRGHGISALRSKSWVRFFEEHGVVLTLASVRPKTIYAQGVFKHWNRNTKEDFWQRELEQIGQQEVQNKEVYVAHPEPDATFGYNDRYYEYRHHPSYVTSDFRTTLNDWHLARIFGIAPTLNADFVNCVPSKRIHAEQTQDVLWGMFSHSIQARRMVGNRTIGRIY